MKTLLKSMIPALFALSAATSLEARDQAAGGQASAAPRGWDNLAALTPEGFPVLGNQAAPVRLIEFISYTCPHCASYAAASERPLRTGLVRQGKVAVEMRPYFRNAVDVVATLLATCGPDERFFDNHTAILANQSSWLKPPVNPNAQQRWANPVFGARMKAVAEDLGLYRVMLDLGYAPVELDRCLADEALTKQYEASTQHAYEKLGVHGTPSFIINGALQTVHSWDELQTALANAAASPRKSLVEKP